MIVFAAKISVKKILACVLAAGTVFVGAAALRPQGDAQTASASAAASLDVKLRTNEQRIALRLGGLGGAARRARGADSRGI